jgi:transposase
MPVPEPLPLELIAFILKYMDIRLPTREDIHLAFEQGEEAIVELVLGISQHVEELAGQLEVQATVLKALQARLAKNSENSSKPPSSDGYGKPKRTESLRRPGQKPNGGQPGHEGQTLNRSEHPEQTEMHEVVECTQCGAGLQAVEATAYEERQVFDIPAIRIEVTAHRAEIKICPGCGAENRGVFPNDVTGAVQYGNGVKTWATYFQTQHFVPVERTAQIFEDLLNHRIAEGTLIKAGQDLAVCIEPATDAVKEQLRQAAVVHADESGLRVHGKLHWLQVAATAWLTDYTVHAQRGQTAMDDAGVLPDFKGRVMHDHWKPYFGYAECSHALCNAHHLRELQFIEKQYGQRWAGTMAALLLEIKKTVDTAQENDREALPAEVITAFEQRYEDILNTGYPVNPRPPPPPAGNGSKKRGRPAQTPPLNLLDRLRDFKPQTLAFMHDFRVPFDNNLAERDVRMVKVKQKVSGGFRTLDGAQDFARIRGYVSTARKNAVNVFKAIRDAFAGHPFVPSGAAP